MCCTRAKNKVSNIIAGTYHNLRGTKQALVTDEIFNERKKICEACKLNKSGVCTYCGCLINSKIRVASEECPVKENGTRKWNKVTKQNTNGK